MYLLSIEEWITTVLVKALGWTFTHSVWQALLALLVAYTVLAAMKKAKPSVRYNLLLATGSLFICGVVVTFIYQLNQNGSAGEGIANYSSLRALLYNDSSAATPVILESKRIVDVMQTYFNQYLHYFVAVWFIIFCVKWLRLSLSLDYVNRISRFESAQANEEWQTLLIELKNKLGISRTVKLLHSHIVKVPLVTGFIKPIILVPAGMLTNMPAHLIESILLHELAHIRRGDYLVNIFQSAIETIFFFNPFILKLSGMIREEREACCDAIAVDATKNKISYVQALVAFGEYATTSSTMLAFAGSGNHLLQRVKRILYNQNKKPGFMEKSILFGSMIMLSVVTAFTTINSEKKKMTVPLVHEIKYFVPDTIPGEMNAQPPVKTQERKRNKKLRQEQQKLQLKQKELEELQEQLQNVQQEIQFNIDNKVNLDFKNHEELLKLHENKINFHIDMLQEKTAEVDKVMQLLQQEKINESVKLALASKEFEQAQRSALKASEQLLIKQSLIDSVTRQLNLNINAGYMNDDVARILGFFERNNVAKAKDVKTFTLNEDELIVNGKKQPASLHKELKEKYIGGKGDHIIYSNVGGSKSISIQRNDPDED